MSPVFTDINTLLSNMQVDVIAGKASVKDALADAQRQAQTMLDADIANNKELYATAK